MAAAAEISRVRLLLALALCLLLSGCGIPHAQEMHPNHLIHEKSPYLQQHAYNPVDWYPWGDEAFSKAKRENKPIFLSVGYSTCHWCHVMERESFENEQVASLLNRDFVAIKVDREERPDIDRQFLLYLENTTGSAGWPMTIFLTPDGKPFMGGTYMPPDSIGSLTGLKELLPKIAREWKDKPDQLRKEASAALDQLRKLARPDTAAGVDRDVLEKSAFDHFWNAFDHTNGGFGEAPKFPRPAALEFLVRDWQKPQSQEMLVTTARHMANGGMRDQIGGGFHRYSTDGEWQVPHFEKMLYDQAQLIRFYVELYQITHDGWYSDVTRDTIAYVMRDLRSPQGGFYTSEDADSQGHEGAFYVWTEADMARALGNDLMPMFRYYYGTQKNGNVASDPHHEFGGKNVLSVRHTVEETAKQFRLSVEETRRRLQQGRQHLMEQRVQRPRPLRDEKIITGWNGQMISALAISAQALEEKSYQTAAEQAANFVLHQLRDPSSGALWRRWQTEAGKQGQSEDYAFLIAGLLDLYETDFDVQWLQAAEQLQEKQIALFWDDKDGGFFESTSGDLLRVKDRYDDALPAANSVSALNLLRMADMLDHPQWRQLASRIFQAYAGDLKAEPNNMPLMLTSMQFASSPPWQIVIAGRADSPTVKSLLRPVRERFLPHKVILLADGNPWLTGKLAFLKDMKPTHAYLCQNYACRLPTADPVVIRRTLMKSP